MVAAIDIALCAAASCAAYLFVINLCRYFRFGERGTIERLIAIKNHERKIDSQKIKAFADSKSDYQFQIFSKLFKDVKITEKIKTMIERSGVNWQVDTFIILSFVLAIIPLIFAVTILPVLFVLCPVGFLLPWAYLKYQNKKRITLFTQQLPDALDLLCNALRAGHSLFSSFEIIVNEMPKPINTVFKKLTDEIALGVDVKDAMKSLQDMVPESVDLRFFTTVVILQREIGGNLIKLLEILAKTIRDRFKMIGQIKAQTMQAKLSGIIVSVIPPIIVVILFVMAPEYVDYLIHHLWGKIALGVSFVLMVIGYIIINKITDIEV